MAGAARADGPHRHAAQPAAPLQRRAGPGHRRRARGRPRIAVRGRLRAWPRHAALGADSGLAKDPAIAWKLINARSETAAEKPSFRAAFRNRRCLIPADGFYEWQRRGGVRQPWLFGLRHGAPFAFAGLWEQWRIPEGTALTGSLAERNPGDAVETCTILTTAANETVAPVHGRMPVILPPDAWEPWLAGGDVTLAPYPEDDMTAHPVSTLVNKAANEDPRCVEPITLI